MNNPLLQTENWQNFQKDLGKTTFFEKTSDFSYLAILEETKAGNYLYVPYGPLADSKDGFKEALKSLKSLAKSKNTFFIRIEPQNILAESILASENAKKSKDLNPKDTWVLDLTQEKSEILTNFSQGTRTRYNQFQKKGLSVETSKNPEDIKFLVELQQKLAKSKNIGTFSEEYLKTELKQPFATLYLVKYLPENETSEKIIAASLFFDDETTRYYMQSAADAEYKKLPGTVALLSTALFDAKEKGLKSFDFWGIAPEGAGKDHPWAGFTEFKKSFGGFPVHYCGTYDLIINKNKYFLYSILRKINRFLRKI